MQHRALLVLLIAVLATVACATTPRTASTLTGLVLPVAPDGAVSLDTQGTVRAVAGPADQVEQLARLPGAIVILTGRVGATSARVRSFEIIDAGDGLRPLVGRMIVDQAGIQLEDDVTGTRLALRGAALAELRYTHLSRVWVTGSVVGPQIFLVAHWGLLQPPPHPK